ncbi:SHOCT domain-containing protein [Actinomadura sp. NTSP31]|uniref:SHOCT domain-containing protein n=1 Tax=Actinomadura sp. NTSP31 TaxID=1735447 RepID=UPI0035C05380
MNMGYVLTAAGPGGGWGHMGNAGGAGWMWIWGAVMIVLLIVLIAVAGWVLVRLAAPRRDAPAIAEPAEHRHAREILADRYARGEITSEEYDERLARL